MAAREAGSFFRSTSARWAGTSETTADSHRNDAIFERPVLALAQHNELLRARHRGEHEQGHQRIANLCEKNGSRRKLDVRQPPQISAPVLQIGVPAAYGIADGDHPDPNHIHNEKAETVVPRKNAARAAQGWRRKQQKPVRAVAKGTEDDREHMREKEMK